MTKTFGVAKRRRGGRTGIANTLRPRCARGAGTAPLAEPYKGVPHRLSGTPRAAMTPLAQLLLAACVLHAVYSATVPHAIRNIPEPIPAEPVNPFDKEAAQPAVDRPNPVKDVENELRFKPADIPVEVVLEESRPSIKTNEINNEEEIKRPSIDLRNPGPPQRQEHETQNPETFSEAQEKVRNSILQTHELLRQGFQGVTDDIQNWFSNNQQINMIQQNIQTLRDSFSSQIQKLNATVQALAQPQSGKPDESPQQAHIKTEFEKVETRLKSLESNFNNGVRALSDGVNIVAYLRADGDAASTAQPAPANPAQIMIQTLATWQNSVSDSWRNMTQSLYNMMQGGPNQGPSTATPGAASDVLADTPDGSTTTQRYPWQSWQLPNLPNLPNFGLGQGQGQSQGQGQQTPPASPSSPGIFTQFLSNFSGLFSGAGLPAAPAASSNAAGPGSNAVADKPSDEKQPEAAAASPVPAPAPALAPQTPPAPVGPIRQILNNNPVVQGIAGTVQRIQSSINNPEKPRDTVKPDDVETKGGFYGRPPRPGGSGDNNNSGLKQQSESIKEDSISEAEKKPEPNDDKKETKPEVVSEKTE